MRFLTQIQAGLKDICLADDAFTEFIITQSRKIWTINAFSVFASPTLHSTENWWEVINNTANWGVTFYSILVQILLWSISSLEVLLVYWESKLTCKCRVNTSFALLQNCAEIWITNCENIMKTPTPNRRRWKVLASDSLFLTHKHQKDVKGLSGKKCALRNMQSFYFSLAIWNNVRWFSSFDRCFIGNVSPQWIQRSF